MTELAQIDREDYKPLYAQVADRIAEYIEQNDLKPGDPLPSQNELIEFYGVSQITVRIAMQRLSTEGIIESIQGKGTFVAEKKIRERIIGVKSLEERLLREGFSVQNRYVESYYTAPTNRIQEDLELPEDHQTFKIRRLKIVNDTIFGLETRHFPQDVSGRFTKEELKTHPFLLLLARHRDLEIKRIVYKTRASSALELESEMMGLQAGCPVLIQYGVFYNRNERPVLAGRITYIADKIELEYEVRNDGLPTLKILETTSL
jgi:GntR family transcriptional regulator